MPEELYYLRKKMAQKLWRQIYNAYCETEYHYTASQENHVIKRETTGNYSRDFGHVLASWRKILLHSFVYGVQVSSKTLF